MSTNGLGHNMGKMSAADRESSAVGLRQLRIAAERHKAAYDEHVRECPACAKETTWFPTELREPGTGLVVVLHCHSGYSLAMRCAGFDMVYQSSKANLATFGVKE